MTIIFKKKLILIYLITFSSLGLLAETRVNTINFSFSNTKISREYNFFKEHFPNLLLEYDRKITNWCSIGCYAGIGLFEELSVIKEERYTHYSFIKYSNSGIYGVSSKIQILPLLFESELSRIDIYVKGKAGLISMNSSTDANIVPVNGTYFDFSFMGGVAFYFSKTFGLFAESGYKRFKYHNGFTARYGLTFRF